MSDRYRIALRGCDDETRIWMDLTREQLATVQAAASAFEDASTSGCQPTMVVGNGAEALAREHDDRVLDRLDLASASEITGGAE